MGVIRAPTRQGPGGDGAAEVHGGAGPCPQGLDVGGHVNATGPEAGAAVLEMIGYWAEPNRRGSKWPKLSQFQRPGALTADERERVARYLDAAPTLLTTAGVSTCRGCGNHN